MRLRTLLALLAVALALPSFATEITRGSILAAMNAYRAQQMLPPLREDPRLEAAAEDRMRDMEELGYWAHLAPDGRSPFLWLKPHGYDFRSAGENLACGFETTELLVAGWMESRGHRENILSTDFADCGIAILDGRTNGPGAGKSVVVMFGRASQ
jgi:uncharacterized protein YkwD